MGGYIFSIGRDNAIGNIKKCVYDGVYSTNMHEVTNRNLIPFEGTFADYCSMKPGDNIYFFSNRKIYGIGVLIKVGLDCKYNNYPSASTPIQENYDTINNEMIINNDETNVNNRWICTFKPDPLFFANPVDMDDVLSYKPDTFKTLRTFWKKSFTKINDEENNSLKEFILLRNQNNAENHFDFSESFHNTNMNNFNNPKYLLSYQQIIESALDSNNNIKHEMALESGLILELSNNDSTILGHWDYLSHQVEASPFKPIDYMDKIDVFGYRFLKGTSIISKYLIVENKNEAATLDTVNQITKYVDWIVKNYAYGNYDMIEAYILAPSYDDKIKKNFKEICKRNYIISSHPVVNKTWNDVKLISYTYNNSKLNFKEEGI